MELIIEYIDGSGTVSSRQITDIATVWLFVQAEGLPYVGQDLSGIQIDSLTDVDDITWSVAPTPMV